jgi:hypothetical protein
MNSTLARLGLLLLAATIAVGCAQSPSKSEPKSLEDRALARWQAIIGSDWAQAYAFLTPGYREATPLDRYESNLVASRVRWSEAHVIGSSCASPDRCDVRVSVDFGLRGGLPGVGNVASKQQMTETWLRIDGNWYHLPRPSIR